MVDSLSLWLHLLGATLWVGPQFTLALVSVPVVRSLQDPGLRGQVTRRLTARFAMLTTGALALLIVTGIENVRAYAPGDMFDLRYGPILVAKLILVAMTVVVTLYHGAVVGPRLLRATEAGNQGEARRLRVFSMGASMLNLVLALAILYAAALLGNTGFSWEPR